MPVVLFTVCVFVGPGFLATTDLWTPMAAVATVFGKHTLDDAVTVKPYSHTASMNQAEHSPVFTASAFSSIYIMHGGNEAPLPFTPNRDANGSS